MILWPRCRDQPQPGLVRIMSTMSSPSGAMGRTAVGESTTSHPTGVSGWYIDRTRSGSGIKQRLLTGKASLVTSKSASSIQRSHRYRRDESNEPGVLCMIIIIERPNLGHRVSPRLRPPPELAVPEADSAPAALRTELLGDHDLDGSQASLWRRWLRRGSQKEETRNPAGLAGGWERPRRMWALSSFPPRRLQKRGALTWCLNSASAPTSSPIDGIILVNASG